MVCKILNSTAALFYTFSIFAQEDTEMIESDEVCPGELGEEDCPSVEDGKKRVTIRNSYGTADEQFEAFYDRKADTLMIKLKPRYINAMERRKKSLKLVIEETPESLPIPE